ncbi:MAG: hypothetical protein ACRD5B_06110 [Nitrososphaeraceae archaeon]
MKCARHCQSVSNNAKAFEATEGVIELSNPTKTHGKQGILDRFRIKELYQTKPSEQEWYYSWQIRITGN